MEKDFSIEMAPNLTKVYKGQEVVIIENKILETDVKANEFVVLRVEEKINLRGATEAFLVITKFKDNAIVDHLILNFKDNEVGADFKRHLSAPIPRAIRIYCDDSENEITRFETF